MNITKSIERSKKYNEAVSATKLMCKKNVEFMSEIYSEKPCFHNIVVKFYGTIKSYNEEKPLYICLGCYEDLTEKAEEIEKDLTKYIIDFTSEYWYFVSKKNEESNHYALIDYLRDLAIENSIKLPEYTDADFSYMVNDNVSHIMKQNCFK